MLLKENKYLHGLKIKSLIYVYSKKLIQSKKITSFGNMNGAKTVSSVVKVLLVKGWAHTKTVRGLTVFYTKCGDS